VHRRGLSANVSGRRSHNKQESYIRYATAVDPWKNENNDRVPLNIEEVTCCVRATVQWEMATCHLYHPASETANPSTGKINNGNMWNRIKTKSREEKIRQKMSQRTRVVTEANRKPPRTWWLVAYRPWSPFLNSKTDAQMQNLDKGNLYSSSTSAIANRRSE